MKKVRILNEKGNTLVLALIVLAVVMIMGTGLLAKSLVSQNTTQMQINNQQAYYVAKSALDAVVKIITSPPDSTNTELIQKVKMGMNGSANTITSTKWTKFDGTPYEYKLDIVKSDNPSDNQVIIKAQSRLNNTIAYELDAVIKQKQQLGNEESGIIIDNLMGKIASEVPPKGNPGIGDGSSEQVNSQTPMPVVAEGGVYSQNDYIIGEIIAKGNVSLNQGFEGVISSGGEVQVSNRLVKGNITAEGDVVLHKGIEGVVVAGGKVTINNDPAKGEVYANEEVYINKADNLKVVSGGKISIQNGGSGDLYALGDVEVGGNGWTGNIYSTGNVKVQNGITGKIYALGDVELPTQNSNKVNICSNGNIYVYNNSAEIRVCGERYININNVPNGSIVCGKHQGNISPCELGISIADRLDGERHHHEWCSGEGGEGGEDENQPQFELIRYE